MKLSWIALSLGLVVGCSSSTQAPAEDGSKATDLISRGAGLYADECAQCHGDAGEGSKKAPALVGNDALPLAPRPGSKRQVQFRTALDVFEWVKANMPANAPGSLSDDDYLAILAFDLKANGVDLSGRTLDAATASAIVLHPDAATSPE